MKILPLLSLLAAGLILSPTLVKASDDRDRGHHKQQYSNDRGQSHDKHQKKSHRRDKHAYNNHGRSHGKQRSNYYGHKPKHQYKKRYHYNNSHSYNRHDHHPYSNHHQPVYIVDDHHYRNRFIGLDTLRFMIGLHTDNFDITFRD